MQRSRRSTALAALLLAVALVGLVVPPASADARNGTCARGYRLATFSHSYAALGPFGQKLWTIKWRTRWCYSYNKRRIGSVYAPRPSVAVHGIADTTWFSKGVEDHSSYYSDRDYAGRHHRGHPRWSHISWFTIKMRHCIVPYAICNASYYRVGTIAYMDGSRNLIEPRDGH